MTTLKKLFIAPVFAVALFASQSTIAQDQTTSSTPYNMDAREELKVGIKAGMNYSNVYSESGNDFVADGKAGFAGGVFVSIPLNQLIGVQGSTATKIKAIHSRFFWASPFKLNDGTKITEYMIQFVFETKHLNDFYAIVKADFDIPTIVKGLQNVTVTGTGSAVPGTYDMEVLTTATKSNLGDTFGDDLADPALWVATNFLTGNAITISTTVYNAVTKKYALGLNVADPDYPGVGEFSNINIAAPAVLQAAGIDGYESTGAAKIVKN